MKRSPPIALALCLTVTVLAAALYFFVLKTQAQQDLQNVATIYSERTAVLIDAAFRKTDSLTAVARILDGTLTQSQFDELAAAIYDRQTGTRAVQFTTGTVVTYCYPMEGNENVVGRDLMDNPLRAADVQAAIDTKSIVLSGPYTLTQGGLGVVARNPVFLPDGSGGETFSGFAVIVLDLPGAIRAAGLDEIPGCRYQLYAPQADGSETLIAGDPAMDRCGAVTAAVAVPHGDWILAVRPAQPLASLWRALAVLLAGTLASLLIAYEEKVLLLRSANRAKTQFLSNMSHDMRTPLNAILGFSRMGAESRDLAESQRCHRQAGEAARYLSSLVSSILEAGRAETGKLTLEPAPCRAVVPIEAAFRIASAEDAAAKRRCGLSCLIPQDFWAMLDEDKVTRICVNLLNNAVKYTAEGGSVQMTAVLVPGEPPALELTVADDGIGISEEFQKKMFHPFEQERPGRADGVGLGLSIVRQLVTLMGGTIACRSHPGRGTIFTVRLPAPPAEAPAPAAEAPRPCGLQGARILVAEDNDVNFTIADRLLRSAGAETERAPNGAEALAMFQSSPPGRYSAILMDLSMPVLGGLDAARQLRALPRPDAKTVPIAAMTANAFEEDVAACLAAGMDAHIPKPIDPKQLFSVLSALIAKNSPCNSPAPPVS